MAAVKTRLESRKEFDNGVLGIEMREFTFLPP